ncbi:MAG: retinol dehydrogenase [Mycobacterium sp.]|jgi:NAD(P)-dependent dehydrogenase (short-subunit alcohol dehydrogenase family)|nr:retinol dehydrogenase [Mycobacterium sp.]
MPSVLVTGAARGIGKSIVTHLAASGWDVVAGVRSEQDAGELAGTPRVAPVLLDITDDAQISSLQELLPECLDAIVNNAGIAVGGPLEAVSPADLRRQFDVNVVGQIAVTQAVLPRLRESRGRIVFISSVNGKIATPMLGAYSASKFALEAAADALRMELKPWGIAVSVVEPAQTDTDLWRKADDMIEAVEGVMSPEHRTLYAKHIAGMRKSIPMAQRLAVPAEKVAGVVEEALTARRPRARYPVGIGPALQAGVIPKLPTRLRDPLLRKVVGQP